MAPKPNGGIHVTWPMIAFMATFAVSIVTGAIQLGTVQTHVIINTERLALIEIREREHLIEISSIKARQQMNEERIKVLEEILRKKSYP